MEETEMAIVLVVSALTILGAVLTINALYAQVYAASQPPSVKAQLLPVRVSATLGGGAVRVEARSSLTGEPVPATVRVFIVDTGCNVTARQVVAPATLPYTPGYWYIPAGRAAKTTSYVEGRCRLGGEVFSFYGLGSTRGAVHVAAPEGPRLLWPEEHVYVRSGDRWVEVVGLPGRLHVYSIAVTYVNGTALIELLGG